MAKHILSPLILTQDDLVELEKDPSLNTWSDEKNNDSFKNISVVINPHSTLKCKNGCVIFDKNSIYEFKIDYYNHGILSGQGFWEYCKVEFDPDNNYYKIYGYYKSPSENKFKPTAPTRNGEFDTIQLDSIDLGNRKCRYVHVKFKGPIFTEGPRKGSYDTWILNHRIRLPLS